MLGVPKEATRKQIKEKFYEVRRLSGLFVRVELLQCRSLRDVADHVTVPDTFAPYSSLASFTQTHRRHRPTRPSSEPPAFSSCRNPTLSCPTQISAGRTT